MYELRRNRVTLRLGEEVEGIEVNGRGEGNGRVRIKLASGKRLASEQALYSIGRTGVTANLGLEAAGLSADERGRLAVNEHFQTEVPHIYAVGDVVGFPALAATAMEQGRLAARPCLRARCPIDAGAAAVRHPTRCPRSRPSGARRRS